MTTAGATRKRSIELDFIRGIALLLILSFHYRRYDLWFAGPRLQMIQQVGWSGVDLFFVLSGFLVGGLLMQEWKSTGCVDAWRFLKRRAFKIWPSYYLLIFTAACLHVRPLRTFFWQNVLNIQSYVPSSLSHTWSLAVEEHFYLGAAALLWLWSSRRWSPRLLIGFCITVAIAVELARARASVLNQPYYYHTHMRVDALLLGLAAAAVKQFEPRIFAMLREQRWLLALIVAAAALRLAWDPTIEGSPAIITEVDWGCLAALLLLSRPGKQPRGRFYRGLARLGIYSYGIYLWHLSILRPVDWVVARTPAKLVPAMSTLLPYAGAAVLGITATKLVEWPALRLRERLVPPKTPEPRLPFDTAEFAGN